MPLTLRDKLGVTRGDRVAVFFPLSTRLTAPELQFIVGDSSPKAMIHDTDLAEVALTVAKLCNVSSSLLLGVGHADNVSRPYRHPMALAADTISVFQKFRLTPNPNQKYIDLVPSRYEGRFAIVTDAGWDAVDADVPLTDGADAYGEVVWS